jgi:hypothetical protein
MKDCHEKTMRSAINRIAALAGVACLPTVGLALDDCSAELAIFDQRIENTDHPDYNVQLALQMRRAIEQMCGILDEQALGHMLDNLDEVLPPGPNEQPRERRAQPSISATDDVDRARVTSSVPPRQSAVVPSMSGASPRGRSLAAQFIDRPDDMDMFAVWDMDIHDGNARVLYSTTPSTPQFGLPDWQAYVYVAEIDNGGRASHHLVTSRQASDHAALALRRGHDEVLFQRRIGRPNEPATLERWSISRSELLSAVPVPDPAWPDGTRHDWQPFRTATSDGNVFFNGSKTTGTGGNWLLAWFESAPDGTIVGQGSLTRPDKTVPTTWFETDNGGAGLTVSVSAASERGIESSIDTPILREIAERRIHAVVGSEKRLLVVSDDGTDAWESEALERELLWSGDMAIPRDLPPAEMLRQNQAQMLLTQSVAAETGGTRTVKSLDVGMKRVEMIEPTSDGYAVLATVHADRSIDPPIHGPYLLHLARAGGLREIYLNPLAEKLDTRFTLLTASPRDEIYLLGMSAHRGESAHILRLGKDGNVDAHARASDRQGMKIEGLLADESGVWVIGHGLMKERRGPRLWAERIEFP